MKLIYKFLLLLVLLLLNLRVSSFAESTYVIDTPTTGMLDYGGYDLNFRLFSNGGIITRLDFGVFRMVNLGLGWEAQKVIGSDNVVASDKISVSPPALYMKIRPFEGGLVLPAFVLGYDGQGYFYDRDKAEFTQKEKGIFAAIGREILFPGFSLTLGGNIADFKNNTITGFANILINLEDKFNFLAEYDNIQNDITLNRLNIGSRFFINKDLSVDLAGRYLGSNTDISNASSQIANERIIRINYVSKF
ncbi:MAG: hypothetical protein LHV68_10655 [Elusimicrobia bacterium]|nr:hypothetical protein [Candidatus Liberimonas magnetica]